MFVVKFQLNSAHVYYKPLGFISLFVHCFITGDLPIVELPDYMNRSIWFNTSSRNTRYFFNLPTITDPNIDVTSAVLRLHLKRRDGKWLLTS